LYKSVKYITSRDISIDVWLINFNKGEEEKFEGALGLRCDCTMLDLNKENTLCVCLKPVDKKRLLSQTISTQKVKKAKLVKAYKII
jgi:hypothetical protein